MSIYFTYCTFKNNKGEWVQTVYKTSCASGKIKTLTYYNGLIIFCSQNHKNHKKVEWI